MPGEKILPLREIGEGTGGELLKIRKITNAVFTVLIILGAWGGIAKIGDMLTPDPPIVVDIPEQPTAEEAFAVQVAKNWLTVNPNQTKNQREDEMKKYFSDFRLTEWNPTVAQVPEVISVVKTERYSDTFLLITVSAICRLGQDEERVLQLNVPVIRKDAGLAVFGEPFILPAATVVQKPPVNLQPAPESITSVADPMLRDFARVFMTAKNQNELAHLLPPQSTIKPYDGEMVFKSVEKVQIFKSGSGYEAYITLGITDPATDAYYPQLLVASLQTDAEGKLAIQQVWMH